MDADDVVELLDALDERGITHWVDGGWGVDCLLGVQTRQHSDVDLVVDRADLDVVRALLVDRGYEVVRDWLPTSLALRDARGREVDLHPVDPSPDGGGDQVLLDGQSQWHYSAPVEGVIAGRRVRCCSAEDQVLMHMGYEPRPVDVADMRRLGQHLALRLPERFR